MNAKPTVKDRVLLNLSLSRVALTTGQACTGLPYKLVTVTTALHQLAQAGLVVDLCGKWHIQPAGTERVEELREAQSEAEEPSAARGRRTRRQLANALDSLPARWFTADEIMILRERLLGPLRAVESPAPDLVEEAEDLWQRVKVRIKNKTEVRRAAG